MVLLSTSTDLYVCLGQMPILGTPDPIASVSFDAGHSGGPRVDPSDFRFTVDSRGFAQAWRGTYGGEFSRT